MLQVYVVDSLEIGRERFRRGRRLELKTKKLVGFEAHTVLPYYIPLCIFYHPPIGLEWTSSATTGMSPHQSDQEDEETPLLQPERQHTTDKTPLPWRQLSVVLFLQLTEPLTAQVIAPFAPQVNPTRIHA